MMKTSKNKTSKNTRAAAAAAAATTSLKKRPRAEVDSSEDSEEDSGEEALNSLKALAAAVSEGDCTAAPAAAAATQALTPGLSPTFGSASAAENSAPPGPVSASPAGPVSVFPAPTPASANQARTPGLCPTFGSVSAAPPALASTVRALAPAIASRSSPYLPWSPLMSPNTAIAMEDLLQFELFREEQGTVQDAEADAEAAVAAFQVATSQGFSEQSARDALKNLEVHKTLEVESFLEGQEGEQQPLFVHVPVVYTPDQGNRPYKDSPIPYINAAFFRQAIRSVNCMFYTTQ